MMLSRPGAASSSPKISFPEAKKQAPPTDRKMLAMKSLAANPKQGVVQGQPVKPVMNDVKMMNQQASTIAKKPVAQLL